MAEEELTSLDRHEVAHEPDPEPIEETVRGELEGEDPLHGHDQGHRNPAQDSGRRPNEAV